jgi:hypothetical protein
MHYSCRTALGRELQTLLELPVVDLGLLSIASHIDEYESIVTNL